MNESIIAVRYARALLSIGKDQGQLEQLEQDMTLISGVISASGELSLLLGNPVVRSSGKFRALQLIFGSRISPASLGLLTLLTRNRRETLLPDIARSFLRMARETRGIRSAVCTTAVPVTDELARAIRTAVEASYQSVVDMEFREDPELMGGYVLRVGDDRYDTSIASGLKRIQQTLTRRNLS